MDWQAIHFLYKSRAEKRVLLRDHVRDYPMACMGIAAQRIQALVRGVLTRYRLGKSKRNHIPHKKQPGPPNEEVLHRLQHKYLLTTGVTSLSGFPTWAATRVQAWWRMVRSNRKRATFELPMNQIAAAEIQYYWRLYLGDKLVRQLQPQTAEEAACRLQRAWRAFTDRQIFTYFRDLVQFKDRGDPMSILRCINPREASLLDQGSGAHVRFRLGGESFPPAIFYKIFIHGNLVDMCAFSPKDYFNEKPLKPGEIHNKVAVASSDKSAWYQRIENNGWRSVSTSILESASAEVQGVAAQPSVVPWHYDKKVRRQDIEAKRKSNRVKWLRKLYATGIANDRLQSAVVEYNKEYADDLAQMPLQSHMGWEDDDADQLLEWTANLDFNSYHQEWLALGTTNRLDLVGQSTIKAGSFPEPQTTRTTSSFQLGSYASDFGDDIGLEEDLATAEEGRLVMLDEDPDDGKTGAGYEDMRRTITSV